MLLAVDTGSVVVAVALIGFITAMMLTAMKKYDLDGVLKIWSGLGTLVGLMTGSMATYFFAAEEQERIVAQAAVTQSALQTAHETELAAKQDVIDSATALVESKDGIISETKMALAAKDETIESLKTAQGSMAFASLFADGGRGGPKMVAWTPGGAGTFPTWGPYGAASEGNFAPDTIGLAIGHLSGATDDEEWSAIAKAFQDAIAAAEKERTGDDSSGSSSAEKRLERPEPN